MTEETKPTCLYIGLGTIGYLIAGNLARNFPTFVWNRTQAKTLAHADEYGSVPILSSSPWDVDLSAVNIIFTCLPTSKEVSIFAELLPEMGRKIWLDNTSGDPEITTEIAAMLSEKNV
jgi:3-hydroxyisobutyrate dehydrogenase